jgi:Zn-finger protein
MFKSCTHCDYPHRPENYKEIMDCLLSLLRDQVDE